MHRVPFLLLLLCAAGCTPDYPMDKPGTWHLPETSANDANLRTMVADPHDLVEGKGENTTIGVEAGPPVQRLFNGQPYPLPPTDSLNIAIINSGQQQSPPSQGGASVQ